MDYIVKSFKASPLTWIVQVVATVVVIANLYLASKLTPVAQNIDTLASRVNAHDQSLARLDPIYTDVAVIKENIADIKSDLKDVKNYLNVR